MNQIETENLPKVSRESFRINIYESFVEPLTSSFNYEYLGDCIEESIPSIPKIVFEKVKSIPDKESFLAKKKAFLELVSPEQITINEYNNLLIDNYTNKINSQNRIRKLCSDYQQGNMSYSYLKKEGNELIEENLTHEPLFFAISSVAKKHVDTTIEKIISDYGGNLSDQEIRLLSIPYSTNFFVQRFLDTQGFLINNSEFNYNLLKNRYGKFLFRSNWFLNQRPDINLRDKVLEKEICRKNDKSYFLVERKIPNAIVIDHILTVDHVIDKYIQENFSFLHDVFLKMQILYPEGLISEIKDSQLIKELETKAIDMLIEEH